MAASSTTTAVCAVEAANTPVMAAAASPALLQSSSESVDFTTTHVTSTAPQQQVNETTRRRNSGEIRNNGSSKNHVSAAGSDIHNMSAHNFHVVPAAQGCNIGTTHSNKRNIASKADRLKDLELIESFFLGAPLPAVINKNSAKAAQNINAYSTMEILHEHLLQTNQNTSDDERLLNQIVQSPKEKATECNSSQTPWDQAVFERQATGSDSTVPTVSRGNFSTLGHIQDQTATVTKSNRPRLSSSLSRQNSIATMENFSHAFDISQMNSTAWKPMFQHDHQEIPYSPAHIFEDRNNGTAVHVTTTENIIHTTTSPLAGSSPLLSMNIPTVYTAAAPVQNTTVHTAGAQTLLLAAQVLQAETNHNRGTELNVAKRSSRSTAVAASAAAAATNTSTLNMNGDGQGSVTSSKLPTKKLKKTAAASTVIDSQSDKIVPEGHATVEDGRVALLVPDADITNNDVLLGRGGRTNHHIGNATYRTYKESLQEKYLHATKDEKTSISNRLVQMIHEKNGRFLKAYEPTKNATGIVEFWYEVDLLTARKKASQALREINTPEMRAAKRAKYSAAGK